MRNKIFLKYIKKIFFRGFLLYLLSLYGLSLYTNLTSKKIENKTHLEQILKEETKKLGIENKKINVLYKYADTAFVRKKEDGYEIVLGPRDRKIKSLKHELYHIAAGDVDENRLKRVTYLFYQEPLAALYAEGLINLK